jgi:hypothetical protein
MENEELTSTRTQQENREEIQFFGRKVINTAAREPAVIAYGGSVPLPANIHTELQPFWGLQPFRNGTLYGSKSQEWP